MAKKELIIDREEVFDAGMDFVKHGKHIDKIINEYANVINDVCMNGIKSGSTHEELKAYLECVNNIKDFASIISLYARRDVFNFIGDIEEIDS